MPPQFEHKDMHGALFPIKEKKSENSPDATGDLKIGDTVYSIAAWIGETKKGQKFYKVKAQLPESQEQKQNNSSKQEEEDGDGLPF